MSYKAKLFYSPVTSITITLNNISTGTTAISSAIDNYNSPYRYTEIELYLTLTYNGTKNRPCWCDVKILKSLDGSNYGTWEGEPLLRSLDFYPNSPQTLIVKFDSYFPLWKLAVKNQTGGFLAASGNSASFRGINQMFR